ncbi:serine/threonine-protein kinase [Anaeromyxobacter oryzae]|uniref:Uncharacterized protein n=1 Tax=Anaeromyxobacter oryzae TaxID=2918170 RepID=A0ABM7WUF8_9BACT|nr:hypothetical protein [Anaeromyxobacter oryzae]BDG03018.1 hypothetical protein AMOR_20140 [Anaeromyxobacter oryzae]
MRYCEGLPSAGLRPLRPEEREQIRAARRRLWRRAAASLLVFPGAVAALVGVAATVSALGVPDVIAGWIIGPTALVAFLLGLPVTILLVRDAVHDARALGRDLRAGAVEEFGDAARGVAVLPASERVIRVNGAVVPPARKALVGEAAPGAGEATWAVPRASIPEPLRGFEWARRPLVPDERAEVERRASELRRVPVALSAGTVLAVVAILDSIPDGRRAPAPTAFRIVAWLAMFGFGWYRILRQRAIGARLAHDAREGWVARATSGDATGVEVLPASGLPWATGGAPAAWRLHASRRKRR